MPYPSEGRIFNSATRTMEHSNYAPSHTARPPTMDGRLAYSVPPQPFSREVQDQAAPKPVYQEGPLITELCLSECTIQVRGGKFSNYFLLASHKNPEKTLRLYKPAMMRLLEMLPAAFDVAQAMEIDNYPDDSSHTVAQINARNNTEINLYVQMFQGKSYVFVRLFVKQEDGSMLPSTYGVQISNTDNIQSIANFVNKNK